MSHVDFVKEFILGWISLDLGKVLVQMDVACGFCKFCSYTYLVIGHKYVVHQI